MESEAAGEKKIMEVDQSLVQVNDEYLKKVTEEVRTLVTGWTSSVGSENVSSSGKSFDEALELMLLEEKKRRKADEVENTIFIVLQTVILCHEHQKWKVLEEQIASFARRHGQFKQAIQSMVQTCLPWMESTPDLETKLSFLDSLLTVSEGKLYVELERARLTMQKARIFENEKGDMKGAADVLKDFQVETYGAVPKREKTEYILEQMRIFLACKDSTYFTRAKIRSNNVGERTLSKFPDLALKYYQLVIELKIAEEEYLEMAQALLKARDLADSEKLKDRCAAEAVMACIMATFSEGQQALLSSLHQDQNLEEIPACKKLLQLFTTQEIIEWPFFDPTLRGFVQEFKFSTEFSNAESIEEVFRVQTIQHNIRVVSRYYTDIQMGRLAGFLGVEVAEMEKHLSNMVVRGDVTAKVDRLETSISFRETPNANDVVNKWKGDVDNLLHVVEKVVHEIHREQMVQKQLRKKEKAVRKRK